MRSSPFILNQLIRLLKHRQIQRLIRSEPSRRGRMIGQIIPRHPMHQYRQPLTFPIGHMPLMGEFLSCYRCCGAGGSIGWYRISLMCWVGRSRSWVP